MLTVRVLLTDLDNTLYNWVDYFAPCFRAMVHALSKKLGVSEDILYDEFKKVFEDRGSLEYSFSVQELDICRDLTEKEVGELVKVAWGAFRRVRKLRFRCYDEVPETLAWLNENGIMVIGFSNAPIFHARRRLASLRLEKYFHGLACKKNVKYEGNFYWLRDIMKKEEEGKYRSKITKEWELEDNELKPSLQGYLRVLTDLQILPSCSCVVGDSLSKDLAPAMSTGATGIWAKYGCEFDKKNFETLLKITHWSPDSVASTYESESLKPDHVIGSFGELRSLITPQQLNLLP